MFNSNYIGDWLDWASSQNFLRINTAELMWNAVFYNSSKIGPTKINPTVEGASIQEQFGIVTGLFFAFFLHNQMDRVKEVLQNHKVDTKVWALKILFFLLWMAFMPVLCLVAGGFWIKKKVAEKRIHEREGNHFKGFLEGQDVVWSIETDQFRSVINILAQVAIEPKDYEPIRTSTKIVNALRERISSSLMEGHQMQPKMFYQRKCHSGYYYWSSETSCRIETYIRHMDLWSNDSEFITEEKLKKYVSGVTNSNLPENHSRMWEMLVSKQPVYSKHDAKYYYPILFRVSHALGDGVALLRLLLEALSDKEAGTKKSKWTAKPTKFMDNFKIEKLQKLLDQVRYMGIILFNAPWLMTELSFFYPIDKNAIHPTGLTGEKVAGWLHENDAGFDVLEAVKIVKRALPGTRFTDIVTTALSRSLYKYFTVKGADIPDYLSIVVPARMAREGPLLELKNRFSVAMQKLPINGHEQSAGKLSRLHEIVEKVKIESERRTSSSDYLVNYWMMSFVASIVPAALFGKLLETNPATMGFSNLPGPQEIVKIHGFSIEKIGFFLPNFNTTAVGVTCLSYGNKIQIGLMADKSSIPTEEDAGLIVKQMLEEIRQMKQLLSR